MKTVASKRMTARDLLSSLIIISGIVLATVIGIRPLAVPPTLAPAGDDGFSIARALDDLAVVTTAPRVPGSPGYAAAQAYLVGELTALGLEPQVTSALSVETRNGNGSIGRASNVVARIPGTDSTGAILLGGHLDTVHTTTAASDCGGCPVSVVETARALLAGPPLRNDVIFLLEDGEETTRAGSLSFVEQHPWARDVRVAFNLEAMGSGGASLLYVTGPNNGWLIRAALQAMPSPVAYSFVNDLVWLTGTGGSDLDQFLMAAEVGLGLVYLQNVPVYHTMRDNLATLDPATLQHQGATMLALARHFGNLPLDGALQGEDYVYYNLFGHTLIRYPAGVSVPIALLVAIALLALTGIGLRRGRLTWIGILLGALLFLPLLLLATALCGGLWYLLRLLDPRLQVFLIGVTYDREWYTLAFVALSVGLVLAGYALLRRRSAADLSVGALLWWAALAVLTALRLPGSSYAFALPTLFGVAMVATILFVGERSQWVKTLVLALGAAGVMLLFAPIINFLGIFSGRAEVLMNLPVIAMLPAFFVALLVGPLLPAVEAISLGRRSMAAVALIALAALILAGVGLTARFTPDRPKPNMVVYLLNADSGAAYWVSGAATVGQQRRSLVDEWTAQFLGEEYEETLYSPWGGFVEDSVPAYRSPAPPLDLAAPTVEVLADTVDGDGQRHLQLRLVSPRNAPVMIVRLTTAGAIIAATVAAEPVNGVGVTTPQTALSFGIHAATGEGLPLTLTLAESAPVTVHLEDHVYSLPAIDGMTIRPRPDWMMLSPTFVSDATIVRQTVTIP